MRVVLAHPGIYDEGNPMVFPPWGVLCVGQLARARGHDVVVHDLNGLPPGAAAETVLGPDPQVIGLTGKTGNGARRLREIVDALRTTGFTGPIAVGGPLVSSYPDAGDPLYRGVDALFSGDGEHSFADWLGSGTPGRHGPVVAQDAPLDRVGLPLWWESLRSYVRPPEAWPGLNRTGIHVAAARGCTRRCTFCYLNTQYPGSRFRFMTAGRLFEQLCHMRDTLGVTGFYFVDDCFIDRPGERVRRFAELNIGAGSPFRFGFDAQLPDLEDTGRLASLHQAGLRSLYVGIEAASPAVRHRLGKGSVRTDLATLINRTIDAGVLIRGSIGVGWPGETLDEARATLRLVEACPKLAFDAFRYQALPDVPLTVRGGLMPGAGLEHPAFEDYSEYNTTNHSAIDDHDFDMVWKQLVEHQDDRLAAYYAGRL